MKCKYCGNEIADTDEKCVFCGKENLDYVEEAKEQDWEDQYSDLKASVFRNGKASLKATILVPIIFTVICLIVGSTGCSGMMAASFAMAMFIKIGLIICGFFGLLFSYGSISSYMSLRKMIDKGEEEEPTDCALAVFGLFLSLGEIIVPIVLLMNSCSGTMHY